MSYISKRVKKAAIKDADIDPYWEKKRKAKKVAQKSRRVNRAVKRG